MSRRGFQARARALLLACRLEIQKRRILLRLAQLHRPRPEP